MDTPQILDALSTGVLTAGHDLRINYVNQAVSQLFGMSPTRLRALKLTDLPDQSETRLLDELRRATQVPVFEGFRSPLALFSPQPGVTFQADVSVGPLPGGALIMELRALDHSEQLRNGRRLAERLDAATSLVRRLAHEIKNPLGGIRGAAQILEMVDEARARGAGSEELGEIREYTQVIIAQTDRLRDLVDQMLGPQRLATPAPTNIHYVLERVLTLLQMQTRGRVEFKRDYDPSLPELLLDPHSLEQAVLNIALNGVQALEEAGVSAPRLTLKTRAVLGAVIGRVHHSTAVSIEIANNGPEIPEEQREKIFYPLVTTRRDGSGWGLPIAQSIIGSLRGSIDCQSDRELTRFRILLPLRGLKAPQGAVTPAT